MKTFALVTMLLFSVSAFSTVINLTGSTVNIGALPQADNGAATATYKIKRTARTPEKVTVRFSLNYVKPACTQYDMRYTAVAPINQKNCLSRLDGTYDCEDVSFDGYEVPSRICTKQGVILASAIQTLTLDFSKAITLTANASEIFAINISQKTMRETENELKAKSVDTASVYRTKVRGRTIYFRAQ